MPEEKLTVEKVRERVRAVATLRDDRETAHVHEDRLYQDVLRAISESRCDDPNACAQEALKTQDVDFPRWCE